MGDLTEIQATETVRLIGSSTSGVESNPVAATTNSELKTYDVADSGGADTLLTGVASGSVIELKIGASRRSERKYVMIQAKTVGWMFGFSLTTQSFDAAKGSFFMFPFGDGTSLFLKNTGGSPGSIAFAEVS